MDPSTRALQSRSGQDKLLAETVVLTRLDKAIGWARKYSLFPYPFATACCAMEYMSLSMSPYDIDRFGALLPRPSEDHEHWFGINPYTITIAGQELLLRALRAD